MTRPAQILVHGLASKTHNVRLIPFSNTFRIKRYYAMCYSSLVWRMKQRFLFVLAFLVTSAGNSLAVEVEKNKQIDSLTTIQLGDYSLKFEGENPRKSTDLDDPPGLKSLRKDVFRPFLGLRFSAPLKESGH